ncbi:MAG: (2Fe-2S) ferredoxin domain-containing protein [Synergistaceae bacterium]|jgi:NADP-reducing hydrogenase subunit HndB|nr:(2Fe-2S) ferredoxin domain-containing protein [Synergistaceae bacterium]
MNIKNLADLRRIKEQVKSETSSRRENETQIIVGMGTCGIAAGARAVMMAVLDEVTKRSLRNVSVMQTGCIGMCQKEPLVDVVRPGEPRITYGNVKPEDIPRIVSDHLVNGRVVSDLVVARL